MDYGPVIFTSHTIEVFHVKIGFVLFVFVVHWYIVQIILKFSICLIPVNSHKDKLIFSLRDIFTRILLLIVFILSVQTSNTEKSMFNIIIISVIIVNIVWYKQPVITFKISKSSSNSFASLGKKWASI